VRWRIFGIIFVLVVINLIDRVTLSIAMPTISKEFSLEPAMQGLVLSAFFWSYALLQVPVGGSLTGSVAEPSSPAQRRAGDSFRRSQAARPC